MLAKYFLIIRNYVLSVSSQRKYNFYHQNALLDAFRTTSRNIIGRNPSMVIPLLANQDLTPMLLYIRCMLVMSSMYFSCFSLYAFLRLVSKATVISTIWHSCLSDRQMIL